MRFLATGIALAIALSAQVADAADTRRGASIFQKYCAMCHGPEGNPAVAGVPDLRRGATLIRPDRQLLVSIRTGRGTMPGYFGILNERDILDVIAYLRTLV